MVNSRTLCALIVLCVGCTGGSNDDTGSMAFIVASSSPAQGDVDVRESQLPEFHLNSPADTATCNESNILLVAIDESGEVVFDMDYSVGFQDEGNKLVLNHDDPFLRGYWYVAMSINSEEPCKSQLGLPLQPYGVEFYVP